MRQNREYKQQEKRLNELACLRSSIYSLDAAPYLLVIGLILILGGGSRIHTYTQSILIDDLHHGLIIFIIGCFFFAFGKHLYVTSSEEIKSTLKLSHPTLLGFIPLHASKLRRESSSSKCNSRWDFKRSSSLYKKHCRHLDNKLESDIRLLRSIKLKTLEHMDAIKRSSETEIYFTSDERKLVADMIDDRLQEYRDINLCKALTEVEGKENSFSLN
ncbi:hypothetical protein QX249_11385 [Vibrio parahaemolyticus]|uniref:Uncharacterized protein n=1 Tax=Vibrio parahaemolyticus TaxID=670 RepID=A0AAW8PYI5_VIBPH|nr:hypothetical protein [Vibrio parahaemolyticus]EGR2227218.1 hypothetical protein [Vibrio parahaemolyticus]MDS1821267.1 hypothetical protein [Vibrio parahaemolyticus]